MIAAGRNRGWVRSMADRINSHGAWRCQVHGPDSEPVFAKLEGRLAPSPGD
jgi:hypothetical protein